MATRKKTSSSELTSPARASSRKSKAAETLHDGEVETLIDRVSKGVLARLNDEVKTLVVDHLNKAVIEIRAALEDRVVAVEETCKNIVENMQLSEGKLREENDKLKARISEMEHTLFRQEHAENLVVSREQLQRPRGHNVCIFGILQRIS